MKNKEKYLTNFSEAKRKKATQKYNIIKPFILGEQSLSSISKSKGIALSTLYRWNKSYKEQGLKGLIYATRADKGTRKIEPKIIDEIERLALMNKRNSIATIHRKITNYCKENNFDIPSYKQIYSVIKAMPKSVIDFSHQGEKYYQNKYDLIQIRESSRPNEIWQADHTLLDIFILDQKGNINRPWLTIIMDDYSRAIAGYFLSFDAPNAQNTALTLHQAIWNKNNTNWPVCGIPEKFYTDHGSDFTSHHMEQVAIDLKINLMFSKVGVPRGRGKIERFFQTVNQTFLEQLDLLLLEIPKSRKVHSDGIHFQGFRYSNTNLAAYVGEYVLIRYNPNDMAEIRVFYRDEFLCTAICPEIADYSIDIKDIQHARSQRRKHLKQNIASPSTTELIKEEKNCGYSPQETTKNVKKLKRYRND
ncbi:DDE-type integrase/transposase/recombinase [Staphylococcus pseudintermedius]|nr:DDE-type integrase/transposase/recombinase [Staphylococcus pseudintermedius]EGQ3227594.1 DDE-type integrase/transposase/recombinase [Staphylococcus pseudintermedius]